MNIAAEHSGSGTMAKAAVAARLLVGAVLVFSGVSKLTVPAEEFAMALEAYRLFPLPTIMALARILPWVELFTGLFLFLGYGVGLAGTVALALFVGFITALGSTLVRGILIEDCGCFGWAGPHVPTSWSILLDVGFLVLCIIMLIDTERRLSLDRWLRKR